MSSGFLFDGDGNFYPNHMNGIDGYNSKSVEDMKSSDPDHARYFCVYFDENLFLGMSDKGLDNGHRVGKVSYPEHAPSMLDYARLLDRRYNLDDMRIRNKPKAKTTSYSYGGALMAPAYEEEEEETISYDRPVPGPGYIEVRFCRDGGDLKVADSTLYFYGDTPDRYYLPFTTYNIFNFDKFSESEVQSIVDFGLSVAEEFGLSKDDLIDKLVNGGGGYPKRTVDFDKKNQALMDAIEKSREANDLSLLVFREDSGTFKAADKEQCVVDLDKKNQELMDAIEKSRAANDLSLLVFREDSGTFKAADKEVGNNYDKLMREAEGLGAGGSTVAEDDGPNR